MSNHHQGRAVSSAALFLVLVAFVAIIWRICHFSAEFRLFGRSSLLQFPLQIRPRPTISHHIYHIFDYFIICHYLHGCKYESAENQLILCPGYPVLLSD